MVLCHGVVSIHVFLATHAIHSVHRHTQVQVVHGDVGKRQYVTAGFEVDRVGFGEGLRVITGAGREGDRGQGGDESFGGGGCCFHGVVVLRSDTTVAEK